MDNLRTSKNGLVPLEVTKSLEVPSAKELVRKRKQKLSPRIGSDKQQPLNSPKNSSPLKGSQDSPYALVPPSNKTSGRKKKKASVSSKPSEGEQKAASETS